MKIQTHICDDLRFTSIGELRFVLIWSKDCNSGTSLNNKISRSGEWHVLVQERSVGSGR